MEKYKIGDVAKILGISPDLLRYYEKKGVVHPVKDATNDYRYYDAWDINFLTDCLWFKSFGFGIEEIAHIVSDSTYEDVLGAIDEKESEIVENLRMQKLLLRRIRAHRTELARCMGYLGKCDIRSSPEIVRYLNRRNYGYDSSPEVAALSQQWLRYMPFVHRCFDIDRRDLPGGGGGGDYSWGFSLVMEYVREFGVEVKPPAQHLPSARSIHSVFKSSGKTAFSPSHLEYMIDFARSEGLTICGNARGNLVCSVMDEGRLTGFFEVWVPIEE